MEKSIITEKLGLYGWKEIEPVLLAALASEYPLLLIGKHGCAKSFILERLAEELNMNYRFYNASLLNYDDLVGIPIPNSDYTELNYIKGRETIWDGEIVFMDEINRCKEELQNKLFPIIYDKRVQGISLDKLKYRWAAMNPPSILDDDYSGAIELDKALADRFPFIIKVPDFRTLSNEDRNNILLDNDLGKHKLDYDIHKLIEKIKNKYKEIKKATSDMAREYILCLVQLLMNRYNYISTRRVSMLYDTLLYVYASLKVIDTKYTFEDAIYSHIKYVIPNRCSEEIDDSMLLNIATEAISISKINKQKDFFLMEPGIDKLVKLLKFYSGIDNKNINEIVSECISSINDLKERTIMALFAFIKLKDNPNVYASTMDTLYTLSKDIYNGETHSEKVYLQTKKIKNMVDSVLSSLQDEEYYSILNNVLNYFSMGNKNLSINNEDDLYKIKDFFVKYYKELFNKEVK